MAENEAHLQISIEAASAVASARLIDEALQRVAQQAELARKKLDDLAKVKAPTIKPPPAATGAANAARESAQRLASEQIKANDAVAAAHKKAAVSREAAEKAVQRTTESGLRANAALAERLARQRPSTVSAPAVPGPAVTATPSAVSRAVSPVVTPAPAAPPAPPRRALEAAAPVTAPRPAAATASPFGRLKADVESLSAAISAIPSPKISVTNIISALRSVSGEISALSGMDLSALGESGAGAIGKIQDRVAQLKREIASLGGAAPAPTAPSRPPRTPAPTTPTAPAVAPAPVAPRPAPTTTAGPPRPTSAPRPPPATPAVATVVGLDKLRRDIAEIGGALNNLPSPRISVAGVVREIRSISAEVAKLTALDLGQLGEDGAASIRKMQDRVVELTRLLKEAREEGIRAANLKAPDFIGPRATAKAVDADRRAAMERVQPTSPAFVGPARPDTRAMKAAEKELTSALREEASERQKIWEQDARQQQQHTRRLAAEAKEAAREIARAERQRQAAMPSPTSASFVGPMPESRYQATRRQQEDKEATYDAEAFVGKMAKSFTPQINIDASGAIKQVEGLRNAFARVGQAATSMQGVIAGATVMVLGRDIARTGMAFDSLKKGFEVATGSAAQAEVEMKRLREEANRLGVDVLHTGSEYTKFLAAIQGSNVDVGKAKDAFFATAQAMALLGRSPEGASRAFKALEQFASKGQIMSEELRGQLAEQLPGAFNITAKALGMTAEELGNAMESGAVSARAFFDVFGEAVRGRFPLQGQMEGASASFARFNNSLNEIKNTIAQGGFLKALADGADQLSKFMQSAEGREMASNLGGALKGAIDALVATFKVLVDNIEVTKTALVALVGLKVAVWASEMAAAMGLLAVQFGLLAKFMVGHPLLAVAATAIAGATALYAFAKATNNAGKAQKDHNAAVKELNDLRSAAKSTAPNDTAELQSIRDKTTAIRDLAREEQKRLNDNIKKMEEVRKLEDTMSSTGLGAEVGGLDAGRAIAGWFGFDTPDKQMERERADLQRARAREQMANEMLRPRSTGSSTPGYVVGTPQADELAKATAEIDRQIAALDKQFEAFQMNAAAAAELKDQMEMNAQLKRDFEGKVSAEGFDELVAKMEQLGEAKDRVAAGPIIQELNTSILDLHKLADAHGKGVDAANSERVAQEARNRIVQQGIGISSQAAQAIFTLSEAQADAARTAAMAERTAELQRAASTARAETNVLVNRAGTPRIAGVAEVQEAARLGQDPTDRRPTKENADRLAPILEAGKTAVIETTEQQKQQNYELELSLRSMERIAKLEKGRTEEKARQAAEERAMETLRTKGPGGVGLGNVSREDLTADQKEFIRLQGEMGAKQFKIQQGNRVGRAAPQDIFGERLRELKENIDAQQQLAAAHGQGAEAVAHMTRQQEILNQVHSLSEKLTSKQKAELEGLIGTLYDAKTAAQFEGAKMDLRDSISQIEAMAAAELESAEAANREAVAQEARRQAIQLGVIGDREAVASLEELTAARQRAENVGTVNRTIVDNREQVEAIDDERKALEAVGEARIRARAEMETRREFRSQGIPEDTPNFQSAVDSSATAAIADFNFQQEQSIEASKRQITAIGNQSAAMQLLGEDYVRRNAELQMEAQLLEQTGEATSELAQQQIQLAGDIAVATDRMERQNDALRQLANSGLTFNEQMRSISADGLGHMEDALVDIIMGTKSVKEAFADMARSIAADLARMAVRQAITIPLAMGLNSLFMGGMGGGAAAPAFGGFMSAAEAGPITWMHSGGIAGKDTPMMKPVDPAIFRTAPRYHEGTTEKLPKLATNEIPAVLKKDEGVFTPAQMASLGPAGGNQTVVVSPTINVQQPPGATEEQGQRFGKGIMREIQGLVDDRISRAFKPGGIRNQSGMAG